MLKKRGAGKMGVVYKSIFDDEVIGSRELRNNISYVLDRVINNYSVVYSGNIKKNNANTAAIISTAVLTEILNAYKFNPVVGYDPATRQYEAILHEIGIYGCGDTKEEAIHALLDLTIDSTQEYFENLDLYMRMQETRGKLPYFLRIRQCKDINELEKVLGLKNQEE